ncbi:MAG: DUF1549 domain-containing protein [Pirellulaceae bacterium]|nr:DUF1549 domain-containing protein [Pirellulaceae bacterium]
MRHFALLPALLLATTLATAAERVDYSRQIKPLLAGRCYACHGALKQEGGLRLDTAAAIRRGGESGPAAVAGQSSASRLIERVSSTDGDSRMPPASDGAPLKPAEIALVRAWIDQGVTGPADEQSEPDPREHWAFRAPPRPPLPDVKNSTWANNAVDAFILTKLESRGLAPQEPADQRILLRRLYLDLVGLPPTLAEQTAFVEDAAPDAYERVVDQLLASPRHGERWGRHWMDIWRYSDWWGLGAEVRNSQKHMWHWRDWIIESLDRDVGYDEMLRQMLAADELYPDDLDKLRATGFLARHYFRFNRNTWLDETVEHTSKAFLGLTLNCAKCHDHKYDPLAQTDYYRMRAFFEPYQVRLDQVPGEADYEIDGIPRVFDCNLDTPTFKFVRGDEKQPAQDQPLLPGVPPLLATGELLIAPVALPAAAYQPGLRPWIVQNHLALARRKIAAAEEALKLARQTVVNVQETSSPEQPKESGSPPNSAAGTAGDKPLVSDDFAAARADLWEAVAGKWKHADGTLRQEAAGSVRGLYRLVGEVPIDFEVKLRFTILGGKQWKSVGLAFDQAGPNEQLGYISAVEPGSKLQFSYQLAGKTVYPPGAEQRRKVPTGEPLEMVIRVRGTLLNMSVNGEPALAFRSVVARQPGSLALVTYDALASFTHFELRPLAESVALIEPALNLATAAPAPPTAKLPTLAQAEADLVVAEKALAAARQELMVIQARAAADRAKFANPPAADSLSRAQTAAAAERQLTIAVAAKNLAQAEAELLRAESAKRPDAEKKVAAAKDTLAQAEKAAAEKSDKYAPLGGALKTPENNLESAESRAKPFPAISTGRRTALARWLTDDRQPLTPRVAANHLWNRHFGQPLASSVFDFGRKSAPPSHLELLDWLAVELRDNDWSLKHLHRLLVTSSAYRLSSAGDVQSSRFKAPSSREDSTLNLEPGTLNTGLSADPENKLYWRFPGTRMEAQLVRDGLLHLAGDLDLRRGGRSIPVADGNSTRRSLYFVHSHNDHQKFLAMFDDAAVLECYRREQSIVPQQALALANSRPALDAAAKIAARLAVDPANASDEAFVRASFLTILCTEPTADELAACRDALADWAKIAPASARVNLVHALLNHNDFVTVR